MTPLDLEPQRNTPPESSATGDLTVSEILQIGSNNWKKLIIIPIAGGLISLGITHLIGPTYTAKTTFLIPQQTQSATASTLASLGALSGLAGGMAGLKSPSDQYVALMQSNNIEDRIIDQFNLMELYETKHKFQARKELEKSARISAGKKDGIVTVEVDANRPQLAADIANRYIEELRRLTSELALTEAQQRRFFFEQQLKTTKNKLVAAQNKLQQSGFNPGAMKAEPRAAAEYYAKLNSEKTAAEIRLQTMKSSLAEAAPELRQQAALVQALTTQLRAVEGGSERQDNSDYISHYREYKYQEALSEIFTKQYEMARLDEAREGALIQVIDAATPPEVPSKPARLSAALTTTFLAFIAMLIILVLNRYWQITKSSSLDFKANPY